MRTNIENTDETMMQFISVSGFKVYVDDSEQTHVRPESEPLKDLTHLRGKIKFTDGYNYKAMREER
ncbi:MAG: hypothetical protein FWF87_06890 [Synergistaceae bacterium]|nr:hypothetical protein [Synergistaceae bacterium]